MDRIDEIKKRLNDLPKGIWKYSPGDDFNHWELWVSDESENPDCVWLVQDDSGVPPSREFIDFVLSAKEDIEFLLQQLTK